MVNWYDLTITRPWVVPHCYLWECAPSAENHDLPSLPRPTLPLPPPSSLLSSLFSAAFLPSISFISHLVVPPLSLLRVPSSVLLWHPFLLLPRVTIQLQLAGHTGSLSAPWDQKFSRNSERLEGALSALGWCVFWIMFRNRKKKKGSEKGSFSSFTEKTSLTCAILDLYMDMKFNVFK